MTRSEQAELAEEELQAGGAPFVAATVVRAQSPTSVRAGDAAIVRRDGTIEGFVGGACAETSVRLHALRVLETGEPLLLRILPGEAEGEASAGEGAVTVKNPCLSGGALEIFLEPHLPPATMRVVGETPIALALADLGKRLGYAVELGAAEESEPHAGDAALVVASHGHEEERILTAALRVLETGEPLLLRILPGEAEGKAAAGEGAVTVKNPCLSGGALEIFLEPHLPPATMRVVGETPIALSLADLGKRLGYAVELDAAEESKPHGDDAALVVASHGHEEERILTAALRESVPYVGLVASEVRGAAVRDSLDLPEELRAQLHTPAGLEIGAHTPEEIALAILAEIVALRRSGEGGATGVPIAPAAAAPGDDQPAETAPSTSATPVQRSTAQTSTEVAVDPVCGMEVAISAASIQLELDGTRHYFCREDCRDSFLAERAPDAGVR